MLLLVIGGSASGKSEYAEARAVAAARQGKNAEIRTDAAAGQEEKTDLRVNTGKKYYIAAMKPFGEEAQKRIVRHRALRAGKGFETLERYTDLAGLCRERPDLAGQTVLVECLSNLTANEMFEPEGAGTAGAEDAVVSGLQALADFAETLIVVTADVFGEGRIPEKRDVQACSVSTASDGDSAEDMTMEYVRILGRVNARLAQMADEVVEVVYSIPVKQKG